MEKNGIAVENLYSYHLGFVIGPCLNAGGRLDTAKKGRRLLLTVCLLPSNQWSPLEKQ
ncbi:MAG: hypothetical protein ACTHKA_15410 [Anaerocolumna jejuensis]